MKKVCEACNRPIKHDYSWNGQILGIECWKKIALPELDKQREARRDEHKRERWEQDFALAETLRRKDYGRIKSEFKLKFLNGLVEQFDEKGFISEKQKMIAYGTGAWNGSFYDYGMLSAKDYFTQAIILYEIGCEKNKDTARSYANVLVDKKRAEFFEIIGEKDFCEI